MEKFNVLKKNHRIMNWFGAYSSKPRYEFYRRIMAWHNLIFLWISIVSSAIFMYLYFGTRLEESVAATMILISVIEAWGIFFNLVTKVKPIRKLEIYLQEIVDKVNEKEIHEIYWTAEQKNRKYVSLIWKYPAIHQVTFLAAFLFSIYFLCIGNYDASTWEIPFPMVVPFNHSVIFGWYLLYFIQLSISTSYVTSMILGTSYFVSSVFYIRAICEHFQYLLHQADEIVERSKRERNQQQIQSNYRHVKRLLGEAVDIHVKIFEIFNIMVDINSRAILLLLPMGALFIGAALFSMEHSASNLTPQLIIFDILAIVNSMIWPFLYCLNASLATDRISLINQNIYECTWFDYPENVRKFVILILARSQQPIYFTGLGLFRCTMEVFGNTLKSSTSYYLIFRRFSEV